MRLIAGFGCALAVFGPLVSVAVAEMAASARPEARAAATVGVRLLTSESGTRARLLYRAGPRVQERLVIWLDWDPGPGTFFQVPEPSYTPIAFALQVNRATLGDVIGDTTCTAFGPLSFGDFQCGIPSGTRPAGPLVLLGDRNDGITLYFSRPGAEIFGGTGDDTILASGDIYGGRGDDRIVGRVGGRSNIRGGPGDDTISGGGRADIIDPGPGEDSVRTSRAASGRGARDVVRTRDSDIDHVVCGPRATVLIDGLDVYPTHCGRVERIGAPRAIPASYKAGHVGLYCPPDGPRFCAGSLSVAADGVRLHRHFRMPRNDLLDRSNFETFDLDGSPAQRRVLDREPVRLTVRTRYPSGRIEQATTTSRRIP